MDKIHTTSLDLPASYEFLNVISTTVALLLGRAGDISDPATQTYNVQLAIQEVCTNIVDHAYAHMPDGRISLEFELLRHLLVIEIRDTGQSFDPDSIPAPDLEEGQIHGYGLFLIHALMDKVEYYRQANQNVWRLSKVLIKMED